MNERNKKMLKKDGYYLITSGRPKPESTWRIVLSIIIQLFIITAAVMILSTI